MKSALGALGMDQGGYNSLQASAPIAPAFPEPLTGQDPINNLAGAAMMEGRSLTAATSKAAAWAYRPMFSCTV